MIYLVFACFCVFFAVSWAQVMRVGKHDDALFPFCQLRRDVMKYRYESVVSGTLSPTEIESLRRLSRTLDATIRNYNQHKTVMFNIRQVAKYLKQYQNTVEQTEPVDLTDNAAIQAFHARFARCLAVAFFAYTPLIRWEFTLRLIVRACRIIKETSMQQAANYVAQNAEKVRDDARRYGLA